MNIDPEDMISESEIERYYTTREVLPESYMAALDMPERLTDHPCYWVWANMKRRCENKSHKSYKNYGGRGIDICEEWSSSSFNFIHWSIMNGWDKGLELDRKDNNKGYYPDNCRYIDKATNRRNTQLLSRANTSGYRGVSYCSVMKKWRARANNCEAEITIGYSDDKVVAAIMRDKYVLDMGLDLPLNFSDNMDQYTPSIDQPLSPEKEAELEEWIKQIPF